MRLLLLLSAMLAAFVGGSAPASAPVARAQQVAMVAAIAVAATSIAASRRPKLRLPALAAVRVTETPWFTPPAVTAPRYGLRLRI